VNAEIFALCDAATQAGGGLNILGTFDTIFSSQLPATHPQCSIAVRLRFEKIEEGEHRIRVNVVDEDGRLVMPSFDLNVNVRMDEEAQSVSVNWVINIQRLQFRSYGQYAIHLAVDGRSEATLPLFVRQAPQGPPSSPQES
jgi:hypothetical protein